MKAREGGQCPPPRGGRGALYLSTGWKPVPLKWGGGPFMSTGGLRMGRVEKHRESINRKMLEGAANDKVRGLEME